MIPGTASTSGTTSTVCSRPGSGSGAPSTMNPWPAAGSGTTSSVGFRPGSGSVAPLTMTPRTYVWHKAGQELWFCAAGALGEQGDLAPASYLSLTLAPANYVCILACALSLGVPTRVASTSLAQPWPRRAGATAEPARKRAERHTWRARSNNHTRKQRAEPHGALAEILERTMKAQQGTYSLPTASGSAAIRGSCRVLGSRLPRPTTCQPMWQLLRTPPPWRGKAAPHHAKPTCQPGARWRRRTRRPSCSSNSQHTTSSGNLAPSCTLPPPPRLARAQLDPDVCHEAAARACVCCARAPPAHPHPQAQDTSHLSIGWLSWHARRQSCLAQNPELPRVFPPSNFPRSPVAR